jgi:tRNA (guanine37-N1)-methyltransferase
VHVQVVSLFPELVEQVVRHGIPRRATEAGLLRLQCLDLRAYTADRHRRVDDRPYGGGPGMLMQAEPIAAALAAAKMASPASRVIGLSPQGEPIDQAWIRRLAAEPALILVCGRYEGWDERVSTLIDVELSLGDFVLSGGEIAAMALIDACARWLPGALGDAQSAEQESFSEGLLDHPQYTRPEVWAEQAVPDVLLSGNHAAVRRWRLKRALGVTWLKRPELLAGLELNDEQAALLREFIAECRDESTR